MNNSESGDLYMRTFNHPVLPHEQVVELAKKIKAGDKEAREKLILHNTRLVRSIASNYHGCGLDDKDLYQEGTIGLMTAAERYDPGFGNQFSTYATWWIMQAITRALNDQGADIRVPVHVGERRRKVKRIASDLTVSLGRKPTVQEIMDKGELSLDEIQDAFKMTGTVMYSIHEIVDHGDGETERGATIADPESVDPFESLERKEAHMQLDDRIESLLKVLPTLSVGDRDIKIFKANYGLNGSAVQVSLPLEYVAMKFGITRERVRQIVANMWSRLERRNPEWLSLLQVLEIRGGKYSKGNAASRHGQLRSKKMAVLEARRRLRWRFRASPAFVKWQPSESDQKDPAHACLVFIGKAYEIQISDILALKPKKLANWTQCLSVYLMSKVLGMKDHEITTHVPPARPSMVGDMCREVKGLIKDDVFIREDVEGLVAHFKSVMKR